MPLPLFYPSTPRVPRKRRSAQAVPVALTLVAAEYEEAAWVRLTFDRPIDIGAMDGNLVTVDDGPLSGTTWVGLASGTLIGPATVQIELEVDQPSASADIFLNAPATTGIVAVNDGGTWAGASNLILPFP